MSVSVKWPNRALIIRVLTIAEIPLLAWTLFALFSAAPYDSRIIDLNGTSKQIDAQIVAGTGSASRPGAMSILSSSAEFSGTGFRPWPIELHLESYRPKDWGFVAFDNPFYADTIYDDWFRVSSSVDFVTKTEFIVPTHVEIVASSMGI